MQGCWRFHVKIANVHLSMPWNRTLLGSHLRYNWLIIYFAELYTVYSIVSVHTTIMDGYAIYICVWLLKCWSYTRQVYWVPATKRWQDWYEQHGEILNPLIIFSVIKLVFCQHPNGFVAVSSWNLFVIYSKKVWSVLKSNQTMRRQLNKNVEKNASDNGVKNIAWFMNSIVLPLICSYCSLFHHRACLPVLVALAVRLAVSVYCWGRVVLQSCCPRIPIYLLTYLRPVSPHLSEWLYGGTSYKHQAK